MLSHGIGRRGVLGGGVAAAAALLAGVSPLAARPQGRFEVMLSPAEWRKRLGPARYAVLREGATERAGTSPLDKQKARGTYTCAGCGLPLFHSSTKFESGTGWPSFFRAMPKAIVTKTDRSFGVRTEVLCRRCGGHLGHVFEDGPKPTGLRYCMNGLALRFRAG